MYRELDNLWAEDEMNAEDQILLVMHLCFICCYVVDKLTFSGPRGLVGVMLVKCWGYWGIDSI